MFRKYYKEANDSIKPGEDFVNSVINNAKKHRPPLRARYTRYALVAAAAAVIITGAVTAMPVLQRASLDSDEIVLIEETVTDESAALTPAPAKDGGDAQNTVQSSMQTPEKPEKKEKTDTPSHNTSESSYRVPDNSPSKSDDFIVSEPLHDRNTKETAAAAEPESVVITDDEPLAGGTAMADEAVSDNTAADVQGESSVSDMRAHSGGSAAGGSSASAVPSVTSGVSAQKKLEPEEVSPYAASGMSEAGETAIDDDDIPCPDGYYCTSATPNGYTFKHDSGAVISVMIKYGGENSETYISEDGDRIYAVFTSFGLSVTIDASGADMATVEEIINQFR